MHNHQHPVSDDTTIFLTGAETLKLLAEPTRLHLLWCLCEKPRSVTEMVELTGAARTVVSQHLAKLRLGHLVSCKKAGRHVIYSVTDGHLARLIMEALNHADHTMRGEPDHDFGKKFAETPRATSPHDDCEDKV